MAELQSLYFFCIQAEDGTDGGGLRSLRSLRPLPLPSASSLRDNLLSTVPSPYPCPGVDTPPPSVPSSVSISENESEIGSELFDYSLSILVGVGVDGVSLARFCRNLFRLHPSHRYRGGPLPLTRPRVATPAKLTPSPPKDLTRITMENVSGLVIFLRPDTVSLQYRVRSIPKKRKKYRKKINVTKCHD